MQFATDVYRISLQALIHNFLEVSDGVEIAASCFSRHEFGHKEQKPSVHLMGVVNVETEEEAWRNTKRY